MFGLFDDSNWIDISLHFVVSFFDQNLIVGDGEVVEWLVFEHRRLFLEIVVADQIIRIRRKFLLSRKEELLHITAIDLHVLLLSIGIVDPISVHVIYSQFFLIFHIFSGQRPYFLFLLTQHFILFIFIFHLHAHIWNVCTWLFLNITAWKNWSGWRCFWSLLVTDVFVLQELLDHHLFRTFIYTFSFLYSKIVVLVCFYINLWFFWLVNFLIYLIENIGRLIFHLAVSNEYPLRITVFWNFLLVQELLFQILFVDAVINRIPLKIWCPLAHLLWLFIESRKRHSFIFSLAILHMFRNFRRLLTYLLAECFNKIFKSYVLDVLSIYVGFIYQIWISALLFQRPQFIGV